MGEVEGYRVNSGKIVSQVKSNYDPARIRFELAGRDDDQPLSENLNEVFQRQLSRAWHEWFTYGSPNGRTRYYLARDLQTGDIAATYGLMPLKLQLDGRVVKGALSVNTGARMNWRGTGLFQDLGRYALETDGQTEGTILSLGVPNRFSHNVLQRIGWEHVDDIVYLARGEVPVESTDAEQVDEFNPHVDQLLNKPHTGDRLAISKDHAWLNWRYNRPDQTYLRYVVRVRDDITGYIVLKRFHDADQNTEKAHILDIRAANDEAFMQLVHAAYGFSQDVSELNTWAITGSSRYEQLHQIGFRETVEIRHLIVYRHNIDRPVLLPPVQNWYLAMGDTDVF